MFKLRYSWRLFFAFIPEILCFALKKNLLHLCQITISEKPHCVLSEQKCSFQQEFKVLQEFDFLWVWSLSCHITFFEKRLSKIYSLTMIFGHMIAFNIFYHTLVVRQSLHLLEYFTLQNVIYLVSDFCDVVTSRIFTKYWCDVTELFLYVFW